MGISNAVCVCPQAYRTNVLPSFVYKLPSTLLYAVLFSSTVISASFAALRNAVTSISVTLAGIDTPVIAEPPLNAVLLIAVTALSSYVTGITICVSSHVPKPVKAYVSPVNVNAKPTDSAGVTVVDDELELLDELSPCDDELELLDELLPCGDELELLDELLPCDDELELLDELLPCDDELELLDELLSSCDDELELPCPPFKPLIMADKSQAESPTVQHRAVKVAKILIKPLLNFIPTSHKCAQRN